MGEITPKDYADSLVQNVKEVFKIEINGLEDRLNDRINDLENNLQHKTIPQAIKEYSNDCEALKLVPKIREMILKGKYPIMLTRKQIFGILSSIISFIAGMNIVGPLIRRVLGLP